MAIAYNSAGQDAYSGASVSSQNFTITVPSHTDGVLFVQVSPFDDQTATAATYNGVSMTAPAAAANSGGTSYSARGFYLLNPATGANTLAVTLSGNTTDISIIWAVYDNVSAISSGSNGTDPGSKVTTMSLDVTTTQSGEWGVFLNFAPGGGVAISTNLNALPYSVSARYVADSNASLGAASTYSLVMTQSNEWWYGGTAFSLQPTATTNIKTFDSVTYANTKTVPVQEVAIASVKTFNGVA